MITATSAPVWANTSTPVYPVSSVPASSPAGVATSAPASSSAPAYSLSTVTVSTCKLNRGYGIVSCSVANSPPGVPTVIYSTYTVFPTTAVASTGVMPHPTNGTAPVHTATPAPVTGAASGLQVSFGLAAVAAAAAMLI